MADDEILREIATHVARTNELAEESRLQQSDIRLQQREIQLEMREIRDSMQTVNHGLAQVVVVLQELRRTLRDDREAFLEQLRRDRADFVAELRAHREALFRILDRLPPPPPETA